MTDQDLKQVLEWQVGVWNRMSNVYFDHIDQRFAPVVDALIVGDVQP